MVAVYFKRHLNKTKPNTLARTISRTPNTMLPARSLCVTPQP